MIVDDAQAVPQREQKDVDMYEAECENRGTLRRPSKRAELAVASATAPSAEAEAMAADRQSQWRDVPQIKSARLSVDGHDVDDAPFRLLSWRLSHLP